MSTPTDTDNAARRPTAGAGDAAAARGRAAGRSTFALLRDGGYATIGVTDAAVAYVRRQVERAEQVRKDLPDLTTLRNPAELSSSLRELGTSVEERFGALAGRGREVVESLQRNRPTRDAVGRARVARSQVRAAATSVTRAGEAAGAAVEQGAAQVGDDAAVDYDSLNVEQLRDLARERDIQGRSDMNKSQLVTALRNA